MSKKMSHAYSVWSSTYNTHFLVPLSCWFVYDFNFIRGVRPEGERVHKAAFMTSAIYSWLWCSLSSSWTNSQTGWWVLVFKELLGPDSFTAKRTAQQILRLQIKALHFWCLSSSHSFLCHEAVEQTKYFFRYIQFLLPARLDLSPATVSACWANVSCMDNTTSK